MDQLLQQLRREGKLAGQGDWTLDAETALDKLSRFQLPDPYLYAAKLVQAAVAGQAIRMDVSLRPFSVRYEYAAPPLTQEAFARLPTALLDPNAPRQLKHLSVALAALLRTDPVSVRLRSGSHELSLGKPMPPDKLSEPLGVRLQATWARPTLLRARRDHSVLYARCCWSLLALCVNGRFLNRYFGGKPSVSRMSSGHPGISTTYELDGLIQVLSSGLETGLLPGTATTFGSGLVWVHESDLRTVLHRGHKLGLFGLFSRRERLDFPGGREVPWLGMDGAPALACSILVEGTPGLASRAVLLQDGVVLERIELEDFPRGLLCHAVADHLSTDLSGFGFLRDEAFAALIERLRQVARLAHPGKPASFTPSPSTRDEAHPRQGPRT